MAGMGRDLQPDEVTRTDADSHGLTEQMGPMGRMGCNATDDRLAPSGGRAGVPAGRKVGAPLTPHSPPFG